MPPIDIVPAGWLLNWREVARIVHPSLQGNHSSLEQIGVCQQLQLEESPIPNESMRKGPHFEFVVVSWEASSLAGAVCLSEQNEEVTLYPELRQVHPKPSAARLRLAADAHSPAARL
jgi:hypothetical protein